MNYRLICRLLSAIVTTVALAFLICYFVSLAPSPIEGEREAGIRFLYCTGVALSLASALFFAGKKARIRLFRKEALAVIGLGWLTASAMGALPYLLIVNDISIVDSFFESASGLTTTGASVFSDIEALPHSLLFWRALSQWIGGMGVVVFFVAILGFLGAGAKILYSNEASGSTADFDQPRVQSAVLRLWLVYIVLSLSCVAVYQIGGMRFYDALCHMFATVSTGGFSTRNASMASFDSPFLEWSTSLFMALGGCSFLLLLQIPSRRFWMFRKNTEWHAYIALLVGSAIAVALFIRGTPGAEGIHDTIRAAVFQVISIMTTTGFATVDYDHWPTFPKVALLALMIVGGCSASTAGGAKVVRIIMAVKVALRSIEQEYRPRLVRRIQMNGKPVEEDSINDVVVFLLLLVGICLVAVPLTSVFEPNLSLQASISSVFACIFNIGPGLGEVGPTQNYAGLHDYTKATLALLMIMGRLELYAVLVLFRPSLWRKFE